MNVPLAPETGSFQREPLPRGFNRLVVDFTHYAHAHGGVDPLQGLADLQETFPQQLSDDPRERRLQESSWLVPAAGALIASDKRVDETAPWYERNPQRQLAQDEAYAMLERFVRKGIFSDPERLEAFRARTALYQEHLNKGGKTLDKNLDGLGAEHNRLRDHAYRIGARVLRKLF